MLLIQLTREQCRAARGLLNWPQARLGAKSNVSEGTVREFESGKRVPSPTKSAQYNRHSSWQALLSWAMARQPR